MRTPATRAARIRLLVLDVDGVLTDGGLLYGVGGEAQLMARLAVKPAEVAMMGDDLPDLPVMKTVGLALAPANAVPEVRRAAHWVSRRRGGEGCVREAIEMILRARRAWPPPDPGSR